MEPTSPGLDDMDDRPDWATRLNGFELKSDAFSDGGTIPVRYTCSGDDLSPALAWGQPPPGTRSLALVVDDPDAPKGLFTHWMVVGLKPGPGDLVEGRGSDPSDVVGATSLTNDFGKVGWGSPCPPPGKPHHYRFRLLALNSEPKLEPTARRGDFDRAVQSHVLGEALLVGVFGR
jgi:Raf kinase inhibitor-like YbhB/YbcL family protein